MTRREELLALADLKGGSVRFRKDGDEDWTVAQPGGALFSTALMYAQEVLVDGVWTPIDAEQEGE